MNNKLLVFDVETPNKANDRISAIGFTLIENNEIVNQRYFLVNPECHFDNFNIELTGISPKDVSAAPIFPEIWAECENWFKESLIVAHNANFDLCVLRKVLSAYSLPGFPVYFVDTLDIARRFVPLDHYKLSDLCSYYNIELDAHNALSDCNACANIFLNFINSGINIDNYTKQFRLDEQPCSCKKDFSVHLSNSSQSLITLSGILEGVTCDDILTENEVHYLEKWLDVNSALKGNYPYDKIYQMVEEALSDGILEQSELDEMLTLFKNVSNPVECCNNEGQINWRGKNICLSGEFEFGSKSDVEKHLLSIGASVVPSVTRKTDIVLVGGKGSDAWVAGNYGTKVKKALEMQEKGGAIIIAREKELFGE